MATTTNGAKRAMTSQTLSKSMERFACGAKSATCIFQRPTELSDTNLGCLDVYVAVFLKGENALWDSLSS